MNPPMNKIIFLVSILAFVSACDIEGEIRQGDISSTIASDSGAAGGNPPVLGGVYFDSLEGLTISDPGTFGQTLFLNNELKPEWVTATPGGALPTAGGQMMGNISLNGNYLSGDSDDEGIFVDSLGNVGIGTTNPIHELHVEGNAIKTVGGSAWATISDERLKKDIRPATKGLAEINKLNLKEFSYKNNKRLGLREKPEVGLLAQQVVSVFPEAVLYSGQYMMLDYHPIYMAQLKAVQELSQKNSELEQRLAELEAKIEKLLIK
jgi:hypothetical protein